MATEIRMPQLGESITEGTLDRWLKQPGEPVKKYEPICAVITDKVNAEVPSPVAGTMGEILVPEGTTVKVGTPICMIEDTGAQPKVAVAAAAVAPAAERTRVDAETDARARLSPAVVRLAQEWNIDVAAVRGTGMGGRVTRKDVQAHIEKMKERPAAERAPAVEAPAQPVPSRPAPAAAAPAPVEGGDQVVPVTAVRRTIAERMVQSKHTAPHAWTMAEADVTRLVKLRTAKKDEFLRREGVPLTYMPFFIKAVVESLREFPIINSTWAEDRIIIRRRINISVAVALEDALVVPVIHDADRLSLTGLAHAVHALANKARSGKLGIDDVQGGTFTVNNTGAFGSILSVPIINHPQAAIISMEAIRRAAVVTDDDAIAIRSLVSLCMSLDHRILDGLVAGRFLQAVKRRLEAFGPETDL